MSALFRQAVLQADPDHEAHLTFSQKEKPDLTDVLKQQKIVSDNFQKAPKEVATGRRGIISAFEALGRHDLDLKAGNLSPEKLNQNIMQKTLSAPYKNTSKELDSFSAATPTSMLGISLQVDQPVSP